MLVGHASVAGAAAILVANACDVQIVEPGDGVVGDPKIIEAAPGDTVVLTANSLCEPVIGPVFDERTGTTAPGLVSGNGISVLAPGVILDLNGFSIRSSKDAAAEGEAQGADVENSGVSVGAQNVTVRNTAGAVSTVENFTANFDYAKGSDVSTLVGQRLADGRYNLVGGVAHGGGVLAIDRTQRITVDTVQLIDPVADAGTGALGDNGIDWKRCTGPTGTVKNSVVQGPLTGLRVRGCTSGGLVLENNRFTGVGGDGIEFTRDVKGARVSGNTIEGNAANGVSVRAANENIAITGNTIQNNGGCGIEVSVLAKNITTQPNTFLNNAGGDVCTR
jgi:parallel beta-helix repeat protein